MNAVYEWKKNPQTPANDKKCSEMLKYGGQGLVGILLFIQYNWGIWNHYRSMKAERNNPHCCHLRLCIFYEHSVEGSQHCTGIEKWKSGFRPQHLGPVAILHRTIIKTKKPNCLPHTCISSCYQLSKSLIVFAKTLRRKILNYYEYLQSFFICWKKFIMGQSSVSDSNNQPQIDL